MASAYLRAVKVAVHSALFVLTVVYIISGLGITQYGIIQPLTLGLLTRNSAFRIHDYLLVPFVVLLLVHVLLGPAAWVYSRLKDRQPS